MRQPVERETLIDIVYENTEELTINYDECLESLVDSGHIYPEGVDDEIYYIITDSGKLVANGVEQECTVYELELTINQIREIAKQFLETLKTEKQKH